MSSLSLSIDTIRRTLIGSLAVNIFLVAFLAVWLLQLRGIDAAPSPVAGDIAVSIRPVLLALPPGDAGLLRAAEAAHRSELQAAQRDFAAAIAEVRAEIGRTPVDPERLREAVRAARQARQRFGPPLEEILVATVPRMSEAGRQILSRTGTDQAGGLVNPVAVR